MRSWAATLLLIVAGVLPAGEVPTAPGTHRDLRLPGLQHAVNLHLPEGFRPPGARDPDLGVPVLVVQSPGGRTGRDIDRFLGWADREGVVVLGIDGPRNGMADHDKPRIQDAAMDTVAALLGLHPALRFTTGMSGGSADGWRWVRRRPDRFAGVVLQGITATPGDAQRGLLVVVHLGAKDPWDVRGFYTGTEPALVQRGMVWRAWIDPDRGHEWAPDGEQHEALSWMLAHARLADPRLGPAERAVHRSAAEARIAACLALPEGDGRGAETERLLRLPITGLAGWAELVGLHDRDQNAHIASATGAERRSRLHTALHGPLAVHLDPARRRALEAQAEALDADPAVAAAFARERRFTDLLDAERRAGLDPVALAAVRPGLEALAGGDDAWARAAARRLEIIVPLIEHPRRRVGE